MITFSPASYFAIQKNSHPSFCGGKKLEPSASDFDKKFERHIKHTQPPVSDLSNSMTKENKLGEGQHSVVYKLPFDDLKDYVLKVLKPKGKMDVPLNLFPEINLGQPIKQIDSKTFVLKHQTGKEHSVHNWVDIINEKAEITRPQAKKFYNDIQKIADFPQEAYEEFAEKLKILHDNGYKSDSLNPNNILIDFRNKKINFVDFYKARRIAKQDCYVDMVVSILDFRLFPQFMEKLRPNEQENLVTSSNRIIEKCYNAAEKTGLSTDEAVFKKFLWNLQKRWKIVDFLDEYDCFKSYVQIPITKHFSFKGQFTKSALTAD